ncbi:MAG: hypothetical protein HYZ07_00240 [Candidatus Harrisonbacteria bacterium]|nr:hypothetical protein [Candidatus Harrisonbacteria bacterium]
MGGIAAGITVVVGIAWNDGMKMLFVRLFGPQTTLIAQFGYALFVTVVAVLVGKWAKKHGEQPASSAEQSRGASPG